ncbi:MAG: type II CRISPR-associated endonuclease Cas1 [candidate division Zixibacteria bacterium]|nr:type II CRISPR-associated endonuclease Cas1 [candidate division Zixibacteria bacterium]
MDERIIDLSEEPAGVSVRHTQMVIRLDDREESVPLEEVGALVVSHPAVHYTHAVLAGICGNGGVVIICNEKRLPVGMLLNLTGHYTQTERFVAQAEAPQPIKKRLWQQLINAKILAQASVLAHLRGDDCGLRRMALEVRSGDPSNIEAQASRRYWPALFGAHMHRIPGGDDPVNRMLNYGYAVLRGAVARGLSAAGLHPSLGIHHHNRYNPFCLADDLMEPFRPTVDTLVEEIIRTRGADVALDKEAKAQLIGGLMSRPFRIDGDKSALFDAAARVAATLAAVYTGKRKKLILPEYGEK